MGKPASLPVFMSWQSGDVKQARSMLERGVAVGPPPASGARDEWLTWAAHAYLGLGMVQPAQEMATRIASTSTVRRHRLFQVVASARGDEQAVRAHLQEVDPTGPSLIQAARAGAVAEVRSAVAGWTLGRNPATEQAVLGELARLEGRAAEATPLLEEALTAGTPHAFFLEQMFFSWWRSRSRWLGWRRVRRREGFRS